MIVGDEGEHELITVDEVGVEGAPGEAGRIADGLDAGASDALLGNDLSGPLEETCPGGGPAG